MNLRIALRWFRADMVGAAGRGLTAPVEGRMRPLMDADDVDAWLANRLPPSIEEQRANGAERVAAMGADVA